MRLIPFLVLAAAVSPSCKSCRQPAKVDAGALDKLGHAGQSVGEPEDASSEEAVAEDLPGIDPSALGLASPDPAQERLAKEATIQVSARMMAEFDDEEARAALEKTLGRVEGHLEATFLLAAVAGRQESPAEAAGLLEQVLRAHLVEYAQRIDAPTLKPIARHSPEDWERVLTARKAVGRAWAEAMGRPGAFLLVAPPYPGKSIVDPEEEKLNRGWVVFLDATTGRFLPLTRRANVAGFILDRADRRLFVVSWKSYDRKQVDEEGEPIKPALLHGAGISYVDLASFETSPSVDLGDDLVEARISIRSGHVLASVVRLDHEKHEGVETSYEIDCKDFEATPAPKAPPGPMDLIVAYGTIEPPSTQGFTEDADALPGGWLCIEPGPGQRLCAVPTSKKSVIHDLQLEEDSTEVLAESVGILQMDVL
jgi:hypothetical protein